MKDIIAQWGLTDQVVELVNAGFPTTDAISLVFKAHARNAYRPDTLLAKAAQTVTNHATIAA